MNNVPSPQKRCGESTNRKYEHNYDAGAVRVPEKPRPAISIGAVLFPRTEVVPAADALPAGAHDREIMLTAEELLWLATKAVPKIRLVDVPIMETQTLLGEANRSSAGCQWLGQGT